MQRLILRALAAALAASGLLIGLMANAPSVATASTASARLQAAPADLHSGAIVDLRNVYSNMCLDDYGYSTVAGNKMVQWPCNGRPTAAQNQMWAVQASTDSGWVYLRNVYSGLCLDDYGYSTSDGNAMVQWPCSSTAKNQRWKSYDMGGGKWFIENEYSGKGLDDYGWSTSQGNIIVQWHFDGGDNQHWYIDGIVG